MKKFFWDNPYQSSSANAGGNGVYNVVVFESTIAYSFAGGQESDQATVNDIPNFRFED